MKIIFNDADHSYKNEKNQYYTSVSKLIGKYSQTFNKEYWSVYKAYEKILGKQSLRDSRRDLGLRVEDPGLFDHLSMFVSKDVLNDALNEILEAWDEKNKKAIDKGNAYHSYYENLAKEQGFSINPFTNEKFKTIESVKIEIINGEEIRTPLYSSLKDLEDGFHPELILWNNISMVAGQSDMVYIQTVGDERWVYINDFKTNNKIDTYNFYKNKMKSPLNHLDECNYNHYRMQLSTYAWMLEEEGYIIKGLQISHLNTPYQFDYLRKEVVDIMNIRYHEINILKDFKF